MKQDSPVFVMVFRRTFFRVYPPLQTLCGRCMVHIAGLWTFCTRYLYFTPLPSVYVSYPSRCCLSSCRFRTFPRTPPSLTSPHFRSDFSAAPTRHALIDQPAPQSGVLSLICFYPMVPMKTLLFYSPFHSLRFFPVRRVSKSNGFPRKSD